MYCSYDIISTYYDGWALGIYAALHANLQGFTSAEIYADDDLIAMIDASRSQFICPYDEVCSYFCGDPWNSVATMGIGWATVNTAEQIDSASGTYYYTW